MANSVLKSEILFLYETSYNIPNGDPFTGEQRYDEETKQILVSDVRIKRFIRTYFEDIKNFPIYVSEKTGAGKTDAKGVLAWIVENRNTEKKTNIGEILKEHIDVRLFGGISTLTDEDLKKIKINNKPCTNGHVQFTGPVQFALLNPSLNRVNMRMHQNTTHFTSKAEKTQGSIGTTTVVPYSVMQIHGWVSARVAETTGMTEEDLTNMFEALWYGTSGEGSSHSRSKIGQDSILILNIVYSEEKKKIYGIDRLIKLDPKPGKREEDIRSFDDYDFNFSQFHEIVKSGKVKEIRYYTELDIIKNKLEEDEVTKKILVPIEFNK